MSFHKIKSDLLPLSDPLFQKIKNNRESNQNVKAIKSYDNIFTNTDGLHRSKSLSEKQYKQNEAFKYFNDDKIRNQSNSILSLRDETPFEDSPNIYNMSRDSRISSLSGTFELDPKILRQTEPPLTPIDEMGNMSKHVKKKKSIKNKRKKNFPITTLRVEGKPDANTKKNQGEKYADQFYKKNNLVPIRNDNQDDLNIVPLDNGRSKTPFDRMDIPTRTSILKSFETGIPITPFGRPEDMYRQKLIDELKMNHKEPSIHEILYSMRSKSQQKSDYGYSLII